jgi:membrane AbrB-like protein
MKAGWKEAWSTRLRRIAAVGAMLAIGFAGGTLAWWAHMPLPWMLGPLLATAGLGLAGAPLVPIGRARSFGQLIVATSIGLQFTQAAVVKLFFLLPLILGVTVISTFIGMIGALILMRLSRLDPSTCFFATTPGGVVEMANQAVLFGARLEPIAVVHVMRVALIVALAPAAVTQMADGGVQAVTSATPVGWPIFVALLAVAAVGGLVMALRGMPNAWFLGPLLIAACLATLGLSVSRAPDAFLLVAQVLMGTSLGTQFRREFLTRLLPLILAGIAVVIFTTGAHALLAVGLAHLLGLPLTTMLLAVMPGGMAEMVITAKLLGLDATVVTGFQLLRIVFVLLLCRPAYGVFMRMISFRSA